MPDLLWRGVQRVLHGAALMWLLVLAPIELATALTRLTSAAAATGALSFALVATRVLVVAAGIVLGRQLLQRDPGVPRLATVWAAADLVTLALVLATSALPTNRRPGDAPLVWLLYATAATAVVADARRGSDDGRRGGPD